MPPPGKEGVVSWLGEGEVCGREEKRAYMDTSIACRMGMCRRGWYHSSLKLTRPNHPCLIQCRKCGGCCLVGLDM